MIVKLTYFRTSGKYYSEGQYESKLKDDQIYEVFDEVREFQRKGKLPDLVDGGGSTFYVLIEPQGNLGWPQLLRPLVNA